MTNETIKHSQGKWIIKDDYVTTKEIIKDQRCPIATIHSMLDGVNNEARILESEANGKLITAAPELLHRLKLAVEFLSATITTDNLELIAMKEAIKKATS